jgi:hypothetical protein
MESVITFLENNQHDWSMKFDRYKDFIEVADKFDYSFNTHKTAREVQEYLKEKILSTLKGKELSETQFGKVQDHFVFKYYSSGSFQYKDTFKFLALLKYVINRLGSYTNSLDAWLGTKDYLEAYLAISNDCTYIFEDLFNEKKLISYSIIYLRKKGCRISIENGDISIEKGSKERLFKGIEYRFKKMGHHSMFFILNGMSSLYDYKSERYFLRPEPSLTINYKVDIPWGYLFNIGLANLHNKKYTRDCKKWFLESVELTKHYFCIERLQTFNKFSDINHRYDTILPAVQKNILYDQHFSIDQISVKHVTEMMSGMFSSPILTSKGIDLSLYVNILYWVSSNSKHNQPLVFNEEDIYFGLGLKHNKDEVKTALKNLSFGAKEINNGYLIPGQIEKRNYFEKPFIFNGSNYIYVNPNLCNYGFYYSAVNLCKDKGVGGKELGDIAEDFFGKTLASSGIIFHCNKKYNVSREIANELSVKSRDGECDYIVETSDTIIFIELKRKTLTVEARKGNILQSAVDLAQSFFHALSQTGRHEYILRRDGEIKFTDSSKIELSGRNVERVSLSLFDFYSMHDGVLVHELLRNLVNANISSNNPDDDHKVNQYLEEIRSQYATQIFSDTYGDSRNPSFSNCRFFSVPQMLEILSYSSNNEEFKTELNRTRLISIGCKDWFKDYAYIRELQTNHFA